MNSLFVVILTFLFTFFPSSFLRADQEGKEPVLLIQPAWAHPPIATSLLGAKKTILVAALLGKNALDLPVTSFLQPSWSTTKAAWMNTFVEQSHQKLAQTLASLQPRYLRDEHQVIQVALLEGESPLVASTILAPEFSARFAPIFGPEFLVAIPNSHRVYIFSKLVSPLSTLAPAIRDDYQLSSSPVSLEIFELGKGQLHAVGSLDS